MANNGNKTSAATARKLKHQQQALELRRAGMAYSAIGQKLGISRSRAHALVQLGFEQAREQVTASAEDLRTEEVSRLDGVLAKVYEKAAKGDLQAVDRLLKIGERRAKLLGLEAPVRIETTGRDGKPIEVQSTLSIDPSKLSTQTLRELLDARTQPDGS